MKILKLIKWIVILSIFFIPLIMVTSLLGQKSVFNEIAKEKNIDVNGFIDISSKEAEEIILATDDSNKFEGYPFSLDEIKDALKIEQKTYSKKIVKVDRNQIIIKDYYDYDFHDKSYESYDHELVSNKVISQTEKNYGDEEYKYRVPWQIIETLNFLNGNNNSRYIASELKSIFTYIDSGNEYISFDDNYNLSSSKNYTTYFKEERTEIITKEYDRDDKQYELDYKGKEVERKITYDEPNMLISNVATPYKNVKYNYKKNILENELVDETTRTKIRRNKDKEIIGKVVTTTRKYVTIAELIPETVEEINYEKYDNLLEDLKLIERRDDVLQFASLMAGGIDSISELTSAYEGTQTFLISDIYFAGMDFSDIEITPSEIAAPIPRFSQIDSRWSKIPYGNSTIGFAGCGPTAMSMVLTGLTRKVVSPVEMACFSANNGYKVKEGTAWEFFSKAAAEYNFVVEQIPPKSYDEILNALKDGNVVIAAMGPGHFTKQGHFIVLVALSEDENEKVGILVNDSYDLKNVKNRVWDPRIIFSEASQYFIIKNQELRGKNEN